MLNKNNTFFNNIFIGYYRYILYLRNYIHFSISITTHVYIDSNLLLYYCIVHMYLLYIRRSGESPNTKDKLQPVSTILINISHEFCM